MSRTASPSNATQSAGGHAAPRSATLCAHLAAKLQNVLPHATRSTCPDARGSAVTLSVLWCVHLSVSMAAVRNARLCVENQSVNSAVAVLSVKVNARILTACGTARLCVENQ